MLPYPGQKGEGGLEWGPLASQFSGLGTHSRWCDCDSQEQDKRALLVGLCLIAEVKSAGHDL